MSGPRTTIDLEWVADERFTARSGSHSLTFDGTRAAGPSPVDALAAALAGCMGIDVAHILKKGRQPLERLTARLEAQRAAEEPKRILGVNLHYVVTGAVEAEKVERAIALSREKYCSVWHSLRQDIDFHTSFEIQRG
ncbi:MAG: OsmC family protein [Vicinamibacteria bacterium]